MMMNEWRSQVYLYPPDKMNDLYYKVCCYWNAKTEMYDSILADSYSYLYDEAYIFNPKLRGYSARQLMKEYERLKSNGELDFI